MARPRCVTDTPLMLFRLLIGLQLLVQYTQIYTVTYRYQAARAN